MATRMYSIDLRRFAITLTTAAPSSSSAWTVEGVKDESAGGKEVIVLGMDQIAASTEEMAFARACDHIDKWLLSTR